MQRLTLAVIIGVTAGVASGLFGIGGGLVFVPGLVLVLHLEQHRAHGTSGTAVVLTAGAGAIRFFSAGAVDWWPAIFLASGAIVGAYTGAKTMGRISARWLRALFITVATLAAVRLVIAQPAGATVTNHLAHSFGNAAAGVAVGFFTASVMTLLGLGGGLIYVPALAIVFGLEQHVAQGTSLAVIVPTTIVAATIHLQNKRVDLPIAALLGAGGIAGSLLGTHLALLMTAGSLRRLFAVLLVVSALMMMRRRIAPPETDSGPLLS